MGKRKTKRKVIKKKRMMGIPTSFDCPFCNHEQSVECKIDKERKVGTVRCNVCDAHYHSVIHDLSQAVDVYSDWLDECEKANQGGQSSAPSVSRTSSSTNVSQFQSADDDEDEPEDE